MPLLMSSSQYILVNTDNIRQNSNTPVFFCIVFLLAICIEFLFMLPLLRSVSECTIKRRILDVISISASVLSFQFVVLFFIFMNCEHCTEIQVKTYVSIAIIISEILGLVAKAKFYSLVWKMKFITCFIYLIFANIVSFLIVFWSVNTIYCNWFVKYATIYSNVSIGEYAAYVFSERKFLISHCFHF